MDGKEQHVRLVSAIAAEMGDGWSLREDYPEDWPGAELAGPAGARVHVVRNWRDKSRLVISGSYPQSDYRAKRHEITVSAARDLRAIAAEITRRLLGDYLPELRAVQQYEARKASDAEARAKVMAEVSGIIGGQVHDDGYTAELRYMPELGYGTVKTSGDASAITLELRSIPRDTAMAVLRSLAGTP